MNPQTDRVPGLGLPQPPTSMGQLPSIHTPQTFRAPDTAAPHFAVNDASVLPGAPTAMALPSALPPELAMQQGAPAMQAPMPGAIPISSIPTASPAIPSMATSAMPAIQPEDADTPLDEEWVGKAKDLVEHTHGDPYLQSIELSKLKAQYIKARYNKDVKVSE